MTTPPRFIVFGAGAIGGVVGARLAQSGHDVALVARGDHRDAIEHNGLRIDDPDASATVRVPVTDDVATLSPTADDVVLVAVKGQHTPDAIEALAPFAPDLPIVCLQNGVANEAAFLRVFRDVYAAPVMLPATHLVPGVVEASSAPTTGILDIGRYPSGSDDVAETISSALRTSTFESVVRDDIMRWKWRKLLMNLGNVVDAACGRAHGNGVVLEAMWAEADRVLEACGVDVASAEEDQERRGDHISVRPVGDAERGGGSSWQSLARGSGSIETDLFNGEIVLLGRLHGIATPVNEALQRVGRQLATSGAAPGSMSPEQLAAEVLPA
ncbi:ketopantoate reductase family protein [Actinospongicola halichondriae]|uniref:ketopantoate reductase family protein n=1 Tax=Actinospongicola halichondriae TaxID=3236844 RepID=UPI003D57C455